MKKKSGNATIHRIELSKVPYSTISKSVLNNANLTEVAKVLLMLMLNNAPEWNLVLTYYQKKFGWSKNKLADAVENLRANGYFKKSYANGKRHYIVSEFGNLTVEQPDINKDSKENQKMEPQKTQPEQPEDNILDPITAKLLETLQSVLTSVDDEEFKNIVYKHYGEWLKTNQPTEKTVSEESVKNVIINLLTKNYMPIIETHLNKAPVPKKGQQETIKQRGIDILIRAIQTNHAISKAKFSATMLGVKARVIEPKRTYKEYED